MKILKYARNVIEFIKCLTFLLNVIFAGVFFIIESYLFVASKEVEPLARIAIGFMVASCGVLIIAIMLHILLDIIIDDYN